MQPRIVAPLLEKLLAPRTREAMCVVVLAAASACRQRETGSDPRVTVELGPVDSWTWATHPGLALGPDEMRSLTRAALESTGRYRAVDRGDGKATRVQVQVFDARSGDDVEVSLEVGLRVTGSSEVIAGSASASASTARDAVLEALTAAIDESVAHGRARERTDRELVADLASPRPSRAEAALRTLAARRNPAVFEPLVAELANPDLERARRALAGLVTLDDPRAPRAIIEASEQRDDPTFTLEAAWALGSIAGPDAEAWLFTLAASEQPALRAAANEALATARVRDARRAPHVEETAP